jgi:hypothetical protein
MSVLARFDGIVIHYLRLPALGGRLYAVHGDEELVVSLRPLRVVQGEASTWVQEEVLGWVRHNRKTLASLAEGRCSIRVAGSGPVGQGTADVTGTAVGG